jgi:hypothetical protein
MVEPTDLAVLEMMLPMLDSLQELMLGSLKVMLSIEGSDILRKYGW